MTELIKQRLTWDYTPLESYELADGTIVKLSSDETKRRQWVKPSPVVQDQAYWLSIYPDGNLPH